MAVWEDLNKYLPTGGGKRVIAWFHDESVFYANDRQKKGWYHKNASTKPYTKGEDMSLMIADFVSAHIGWLSSPDGKKSAWRLFKPGKTRDGYFSNEDIIEEANEAIVIFQEYYPNFDHLSSMTMRLLTSSMPTMLYPLERCWKMFLNLGQIGVLKYSNAIRLLEKLSTVLMDQKKRPRLW